MAASDNQFFEKYMTPIAVVLGAVIIAFALSAGRGDAPAPQGGAPAAVDIQEVQTANSPVVGEQDAPVTVAVWFDYQCPHCQRFELDTMSQVYENYVTKGDVKIVYKDFQFLGPESDNIALAARAVYEASPSRFHEWFTAVMRKQSEDQSFGSADTVMALTATISGIDTGRVTSLMNDKKSEYQAAIAADRAEGATFGINGTPGTIIGTSLLAGSRPYADISALIDAELAR